MFKFKFNNYYNHFWLQNMCLQVQIISTGSIQMVSSQFQDNYDKGHKKYQQNKYDEALKYFKKAKQLYKSGVDSIQNYVDLIIDESTIRKTNKNYRLVEMALKKCQEFMREQCKKRREKNTQTLKLSIKLKIQLGLSYIDEAEEDVKRNNNNISKAFQLFDKTLDIQIFIIKNILNILNRYYKQESFEQVQQWETLYLQSLINLIGCLLSQAQISGELENYLIFDIIMQIVDKFQKFDKIFIEDEQTKKFKSKCKYFKGSILNKTTQDFNKIQKPLKQDYEFCQENQMIQDSKKSRIQLIGLYLRNQKFKQARILTKGDLQKQIFSQIMKDYQRLKSIEEYIKSSDFPNLLPQFQIRKIEQIWQIISQNNNQWWPRFTKLMNNIVTRIKDNKVCAIIYLNVAQCYNKLLDDLNTEHYCQLCLQKCQNQTLIQFDCYYVLLRRYQFSQKQNKFFQVSKRIKYLTQKPQLRQKMIQINSFIENRKFKFQRKRKILSKISQLKQEQQKLYNLAQTKNIHREDSDKYQQDMMEQQQQKNNNSFYKNTPRLSFMRKPKNKQIILQKYKDYCRNNEIIMRKYILKSIQDLQEDQKYVKLDFQLLFDLPVKQLQILIQLNNNQELDLRNHKINNRILQKISQSQLIQNIQVIKLFQVDKTVNKQTFENMFKKFSSIQYVHLEKIAKQFLEGYSFSTKQISLQLFNPQFLRILKLKSCKLNDLWLGLIAQRFKQLNQLDLAGNQIKGIYLNQLSKLQRLQNLNLSYNPLQDLSKLTNKTIKKLKLKSLACRNPQAITYSYNLIANCQILDLSENSNGTLEFLLNNIIAAVVGHESIQLPNLLELRMKKCNINKEILSITSSILPCIYNLKILNIRFCYFNHHDISSFAEYQKMCGKNILIDSRSSVEEEYKNYL